MQVTGVQGVRSRVVTLPSLTQDIAVVLLASGVLFLLVGMSHRLGALDPLRLLLGFAYVLVFPGYCVTTALFPRPKDLTKLERFGLSIGLSIAVASVLAIILDRSPWGLHVWPIMIAELVTIATFAMIGVVRRSQLATVEPSPTFRTWHPRTLWNWVAPGGRQSYALMVGSILVGTVAVTWILIAPAPSSYTTEFYMLGPNGLAENFPREVVVGEEMAIRFGTTNREQSTSTYRVEIWSQDAWDSASRQRLVRTGDYLLGTGETLEVPLRWRMPQAGIDQRVDILLFIDDQPSPYRNLRMFLNVVPETES